MPKLKALIGHVGVDAGMIMIGDPCYTIPEDGPLKRCLRFEQSQGDDWDRFLTRYIVDEGPVWHIEGTLAAGSLAIVVRSGHGDGVYPVYATIEGDTVTEVTIKFVSDDEEDEDRK